MICVYESGWIGTISVGKKPEVEMGGGNESIPGSSWAHMYLQSTKNYIITGYILSTGHCAVNVLPHSVLTTILRIGASMLSFCRWENRSTERYHNWPIVTKFFHSRPRNWTWIAHDSLHYAIKHILKCMTTVYKFSELFMSVKFFRSQWEHLKN